MQKFLFLLLSLVLLGPLGIDLYLPTIPAIALGLNSSEALIQSTISLFILVLGLGRLSPARWWITMAASRSHWPASLST
ncbi:multidrug efflux system protein MdtL [Serratia plymuthica]|uniref:Multidrug efflux system protein MdtL n=1 Tax=Serratia plymuthica TaxID=82996 RepID=A0A2X4V0W4_SERPL|nr:multidrug efflux system protein MdtL [Serratia plymuthica]